MPKLKQRLDSLLLILFVVIGGTLVVLAFPYLASAYHLEAGGRAQDDPVVALEHLLKAVEWVPNNAQAYRWLGRVYREREDWYAAAEAMDLYTELRPDNPLGYIELAKLYMEIEAEKGTMHCADLLSLLPESKVEAPDTPIDSPYGQPDGPVWHYYVAETTFSLLPNYGDRPTLFMHSPSQATFTLQLPSQPAALHFDMGLDPQSHNWPGDGATFEVFVDGKRIFLEHVDKDMARQGWHARSVDLVPWAGLEITLTLAVTPGPAADPTGDWAGWGEPKVVETQWLELEALQLSLLGEEEWQRAGLTINALLSWGNSAVDAEQYDEAFMWYERALQMEPEFMDLTSATSARRLVEALASKYIDEGQTEAAKMIWQRLADKTDKTNSEHWWAWGQVAELERDWAHAAIHYEKAAQATDAPYQAFMRRGMMFQNLGELDAAEQAYTQALDARPNLLAPYMSLGHLARIQKDYDSALLRYREAESAHPNSGEPLHFQGRVLYELGDFATAAKYFELARQRVPNSAGALYYLALCRYELGEKQEAIGLMREAMDLYMEGDSFSGSPWRWAVVLGDWLVEQGELQEARRIFEQALIWNPQDDEIQGRLDSLNGD